MCLWVTEEAAQHSSWLWVAPWKAWHACNSLAVIFQHVRGHLTEDTVDDDLLLVRAGRQHSSSSVKSVSFRIDSSRVYLSAAYGRSWRGQRVRRLRLLLLLLLLLLLSGSAAILDSHRGRESDLLLLLLPPSSSPPPLLPLPLTMLPLLMLLVLLVLQCFRGRLLFSLLLPPPWYAAAAADTQVYWASAPSSFGTGVNLMLLLSSPPPPSLLLLILKCGGLRRSFAFQLAFIVVLRRRLTGRAKRACSSCWQCC